MSGREGEEIGGTRTEESVGKEKKVANGESGEEEVEGDREETEGGRAMEEERMAHGGRAQKSAGREE